jgi:hypothetical protein
MATPFDVPTVSTSTASEKAVSYCGALMLEKAASTGANMEAPTASIYSWLSVRTAGEVSTNITRLKAEGFTGRSVAPDLEDGMYLRTDNTIFKVYVTRAGQKVAKRAVVTETGVDEEGNTTYEAEMVYEGKAPLRTLTADMRMSLEEAQQFGALYSCCCICGADLNDEVSVALGIGPWCGGREFGEPFKVMVKTTRKEIKAKAKADA